MLYALIMAGGTGSRLWPRSRRDRPKQFLDITSHRTMLQETYERIVPLIPPERVFVITNNGYTSAVRSQLPDLPDANILGEPEGHGTAPAIGLGALVLRRLDPEAVMAVLTADHLIRDTAGFLRALQAAQKVAAQGYLVTLGIQPNQAETGYGYIHRHEYLGQFDGYEAYQVERFAEKPDRATAEQFVQSGEWYWNSGMFVWQVGTILREIERFMPRLHRQLVAIEAILGTASEREALEPIWSQIQDQTIDFGVMERAENVAVIPVNIGWSDVGNWATLFDLLPSDTHNNVVIGEHLGVETHNSLIYSPNRLVATVGVQNLVIVDTEDALLVCPRDRAQEVKALVDALKRDNKQKYL